MDEDDDGQMEIEEYIQERKSYVGMSKVITKSELTQLVKEFHDKHFITMLALRHNVRFNEEQCDLLRQGYDVEWVIRYFGDDDDFKPNV